MSFTFIHEIPGLTDSIRRNVEWQAVPRQGEIIATGSWTFRVANVTWDDAGHSVVRLVEPRMKLRGSVRIFDKADADELIDLSLGWFWSSRGA